MRTISPSDAARALRAIPSEKRTAAVRENGKKGGRPPRPLSEFDCTCGVGTETLAGHRAYCPFGRAVRRREKKSEAVTT